MTLRVDVHKATKVSTGTATKPRGIHHQRRKDVILLVLEMLVVLVHLVHECRVGMAVVVVVEHCMNNNQMNTKLVCPKE